MEDSGPPAGHKKSGPMGPGVRGADRQLDQLPGNLDIGTITPYPSPRNTIVNPPRVGAQLPPTRLLAGPLVPLRGRKQMENRRTTISNAKSQMEQLDLGFAAADQRRMERQRDHNQSDTQERSGSLSALETLLWATLKQSTSLTGHWFRIAQRANPEITDEEFSEMMTLMSEIGGNLDRIREHWSNR